MPRQPRNRDGHEDEAADKIGRDHQPPSVPAVGEDSAVQAEDEGRHAVGQPDGDHPERSGRDEREPHERDVLEGVSELADGHRRVCPAEVAAPEKQHRSLRRGGCLGHELLWNRGHGVGHERVVPGRPRLDWRRDGPDDRGPPDG